MRRSGGTCSGTPAAENTVSNERWEGGKADLEKVVYGETGAVLVLSVETRREELVTIFVLEKVCDTILGVPKNVDITPDPRQDQLGVD